MTKHKLPRSRYELTVALRRRIASRKRSRRFAAAQALDLRLSARALEAALLNVSASLEAGELRKPSKSGEQVPDCERAIELLRGSPSSEVN